MRKIVLDTNAYVAFQEKDKDVNNRVLAADAVYISTVVLGELHLGFIGGNKPDKNYRQLDDFLSRPEVKTLNITPKTAEFYGMIAFNLRKKGYPIPTNDIWIAAHAFQTGSMLLTHDQHFEKIDNLYIAE